MLKNNTELNLLQEAEQLIEENKLSEAIICCQKLIKNEPLQPIQIILIK